MQLGQLWMNRHMKWLCLRVMDFPRENKVRLIVEPKEFPSSMAGVVVEFDIPSLMRAYVPILEEGQEPAWEV